MKLRTPVRTVRTDICMKQKPLIVWLKKAVVLLSLFLSILLLPGLSSDCLAQAKWPAQPNLSQLWANGKLQADVSNSGEGYFMARLSAPNKHKMKLRVTKGGATLTYDLNGQGDFEVFPFQMGSGFYDISLYENTSGKKYAQAGSIGINVNLNAADASFYYPNQYVNYTKLSQSVIEAEQLCTGLTGIDKYKVLCKFMADNFLYDYIKAVTVKTGTLPDIDGSFTKKMGICQDLAAILCSMLRTQGFPARLIIGYADTQYHAWTVTEIDGKNYFFDPTAAINAINNVKDYTVERYY